MKMLKIAAPNKNKNKKSQYLHFEDDGSVFDFRRFFCNLICKHDPRKKKNSLQRVILNYQIPLHIRLIFHPLTVCFAGHPLNSGTRKAPTTNKNKSPLADQNKTLLKFWGNLARGKWSRDDRFPPTSVELLIRKLNRVNVRQVWRLTMAKHRRRFFRQIIAVVYREESLGRGIDRRWGVQWSTLDALFSRRLAAAKFVFSLHTFVWRKYKN